MANCGDIELKDHLQGLPFTLVFFGLFTRWINQTCFICLPLAAVDFG